ncbi:hypothetical protein F1880_006412 [Penicillium rolfsii]|nr:hypothetical protein F1880_006412 [Penicillium rolfsii]
MIRDSTYDIRSKKPSSTLCEKLLKHGEPVQKETKIGSGLSKPTLAEEVATWREVSAVSGDNQKRAPTSRPDRAIRAKLGILHHKPENRRKARMKSRKFPHEQSSLQV